MGLQKGDKYDLRIHHERDFQEMQGNIHCGIHWLQNFENVADK